MLNADITTKNGRKRLIDHVLHESYLEGFDAPNDFVQLLNQFVDGTISIDEIKKSIIQKAKKIA